MQQKDAAQQREYRRGGLHHPGPGRPQQGDRVKEQPAADQAVAHPAQHKKDHPADCDRRERLRQKAAQEHHQIDDGVDQQRAVQAAQNTDLRPLLGTPGKYHPAAPSGRVDQGKQFTHRSSPAPVSLWAASE